MMKYENSNYSEGSVLPDVQAGDEFVSCNFAAKLPHTPLFAGVPGLVFDNCNLQNRDIPVDAVKRGITKHGQKDFCYWLNPDMGLAVEADNCRHVDDTDTITIDGVAVDTIYQRSDKVVS
jgi:hypothetical protein